MYTTDNGIHIPADCQGINGAPHEATISSKKELNNEIIQATNALVSLMNDTDEVQSIVNPPNQE